MKLCPIVQILAKFYFAQLKEFEKYAIITKMVGEG